MNINFKATNTELSEAIKSAVTEKLGSLDKFASPENHASVELEHLSYSTEAGDHRIEILIAPNSYFAEAIGTDFYQALDSAIPKIADQMKKSKEKKVGLRRRMGNIWKRFTE
ncbi:MAG: ribosome-associated translation inhibitor RaiA [Candidatus Doudnabacteria bacterium]